MGNQVGILIFDLDGTISSSLEATHRVMLMAFSDLGIKREVTLEDIKNHVGEPSEVFFMNILGQEYFHHLHKILEEYDPRIPEFASAYPGVPETLAALKKRGFKLALCSNCESGYFESTLSALNIRQYFDYAECAGDNNLSKSGIIKKILSKFPGIKAAVIGDRIHDIEAASENNAVSVGVLYGYGKDEPKKADITINKFPELLEIFDRKFMNEIEKQHAIDMETIQEQVRFFYSQKRKVKIYHGSTNSTRSQTFKKDEFINVSLLNRVVEINTAKQYVLVEPNVPMDKLVEETIKYGLVPPVVPEFPGITVGGGVQGGAGESSSFREGLFHDICLEYEIVLGNGEVVTASPTQNAELFYGTVCSYGSLGVITLIKLRLVSAKDFIHLAYYVVRSFKEAIELVRQKSGEAVNFIDGIMFSKNLGVIMTGNFADKSSLPVSTFHKSTDEWFYLHADKISKARDHYEELIPIRDYLFRYDRGAFWMGRYGFSLLKIPFTRLTRFIMNEIFKTRNVYRFLHATNISQRYFVQDISLPENNVLKFLDFVDKELHIYPLWICPLRPGKYDKLSPAFIETNLVINIGVWGEIRKDFSRFVQLNRNLENKVAELSGRKVLYAHAYYTRDEFWKVYDLQWYNNLRDKYYASDTFPTVYENTRVSEEYKPTILLGIWNYIKSSIATRVTK